VEVSNVVQQILKRTESPGGKTVVPMTESPAMVTWGMFNDPDCALVSRGVVAATKAF
jgi:hypothetical protein